MRFHGAGYAISAGLCGLLACDRQTRHEMTFDAAFTDATFDRAGDRGASAEGAPDAPMADSPWWDAATVPQSEHAPTPDGGVTAETRAAESGQTTGDGPTTAGDVPSTLVVEAGVVDTAGDGPSRAGDAAPPIDAAVPADTGPKQDAFVAGDSTTDAPARRIINLPLAGSDFVVDSALGRVYVSINGAADSYANTVAVVDVASGAVLSSIPVGSNPRALALSEDAATLWVGIDGALAIRSVDLTATPPVPGPLHALPTTFSGLTPPVTAGPMVVLRGTQTSVMTILSSTSLDAVAVLDDGVARPTADTFPSPVPTHFAPASGSLVFGFDNSNTGFSFVVLSVSATGVTAATFSDLVQGFDNQIIYQAGRVYARGGEILDVTDPAKPTALQKLSWQGALANGSPGRLVMLGTSSTSSGYAGGRPEQILVLDTSTLVAVGSAPFPTDVPAFNTIAFSIGKLLYAGDDAVVFSYGGLDITTDQYVSGLVILHDPALRAAN